MEMTKDIAIDRSLPWVGKTEGDWLLWCLEHAKLPASIRCIQPGHGVYLRRGPGRKLDGRIIDLTPLAEALHGVGQASDPLGAYVRASNMMRERLDAVASGVLLLTRPEGVESFAFLFAGSFGDRAFAWDASQSDWREVAQCGRS